MTYLEPLAVKTIMGCSSLKHKQSQQSRLSLRAPQFRRAWAAWMSVNTKLLSWHGIRLQPSVSHCLSGAKRELDCCCHLFLLPWVPKTVRKQLFPVPHSQITWQKPSCSPSGLGKVILLKHSDTVPCRLRLAHTLPTGTREGPVVLRQQSLHLDHFVIREQGSRGQIDYCWHVDAWITYI